MSTTKAYNICWKCRISDNFVNKRENGRLVKSDLCIGCYSVMLRKIGRNKKRSLAKGGKATLTITEWIDILRSSEGYCHYCNKQVGFNMLTLEHVKPVAHGGDTTKENVVAACMDCNHDHWLRRGDK